MATTAHPAAPSRALPTTQGALHAYLARGFDALDARLRADVAALPAERLTTRPLDGGWSVAQILEHCRLINEAYLRPLAALLDAPSAAGVVDAASLPWKGTLMGGMLRRSLEMAIPQRAPGVTQPGPTPHANGIEAVVATHARVRALMERGAAAPWRRLRMTSPFASVVRPNFGEACLIILRHGERHAGQLERTAAAIGAPTRGA